MTQFNPIMPDSIVAVADGLVFQAKELERHAATLRRHATVLYNEYRTAAPISELVDQEVAVLIDSLAAMRDLLTDQGIDAPNVQNALDKIKSLMTPATKGLTIQAKS